VASLHCLPHLTLLTICKRSKKNYQHHDISCLLAVFDRVFEKFIKRNGVMVHYHKGYIIKKWRVAHCHEDCVQNWMWMEQTSMVLLIFWEIHCLDMFVVPMKTDWAVLCEIEFLRCIPMSMLNRLFLSVIIHIILSSTKWCDVPFSQIEEVQYFKGHLSTGCRIEASFLLHLF